MLSVALVVIAAAKVGVLLFSRWTAQSEGWRATSTPLASIMGSGFLISAPLLAHAVGVWALACMSVLLLLAYLIGGALRFNIQRFEPIEHQRGAVQSVALASRLVLAGAYFVSITYYLQLLAAFVAGPLGLSGSVAPNVVTSILLLIIGMVGIVWGLKRLESVEKYAVSLNLGVILSLLAGLAFYNAGLIFGGEWSIPDVDSTVDWHDTRVLLGLLIVIQGFETSRYLGDEHAPEVRVRTMRAAQLISAAVYLLFIGLATVMFRSDSSADVTAVVRMVAPVAAVLPLMVSVAAVASQFSASVADNAGAGGLIEDISNQRIGVKGAYAIALVVTLGLTWVTDVNQIISYASRAFALYYALQCTVAAMVAWGRDEDKARHARAGWFGLLAVVCLAVVVLGLPAE